MNTRLKSALQVVETWPEDRQQDAAEILLGMIEQGGAAFKLSEDECRALEESRAEARRGEFATDDEVAAVRRKHGL